jgi:hypothetical protein
MISIRYTCDTWPCTLRPFFWLLYEKEQGCNREAGGKQKFIEAVRYALNMKPPFKKHFSAIFCIETYTIIVMF